MKNLQTCFLKFIAALSLFFSFQFTHAQSPKVRHADSLFQAKLYTQSLELYQSLYHEKYYSPAMLLKMAYIQEGLGKIGPTLYYLTLYHNVSDDEQALQKMEELAAKFKLSGYDSTDSTRVQHWITKKLGIIEAGLAFILLLTSYALFRAHREKQKPWLAAVFIIIVSAGVLYLNNFYASSSVIVNDDRTYLMEGPSAGANVAGILGEGNQLQLLGHQDVWLKVKWIDKIVYVKSSAVLTVVL